MRWRLMRQICSPTANWSAESETMQMILQERFRIRVREAMDERGWSQSELARRMESDPQFIYRYLSGRTSPGLDIIERFAAALEVDPGVLIGEQELATHEQAAS